MFLPPTFHKSRWTTILLSFFFCIPLWAQYDAEILKFTKSFSSNSVIYTTTAGDGSDITITTANGSAQDGSVYYVSLSGTPSTADENYIEVSSSGTTIESVEFLISGSSSSSRGYQPAVLLWEGSVQSNVADGALVLDETTMVKGIANASWFVYDCSKTKTHNVRIYRGVKKIDVPPYTTKETIGNGQTIWIYGVRVKLSSANLLQWSDGLEAGAKIEKSAADADFIYTASPKTASTGAITYTSNNENVATVNPNTGQVHLTGNFGSALITATQVASGSFPQASITYTIHVAPTEIITQSDVGPTYYDDHNTANYCFADNSHCLNEFVDSIWVEAVGVSGYQWQQSADGVTWTDMQGFTSSYFFPPIPQTEITVATTTYYRCQIIGAATPLYSEPVQIVVEPAKGCYPNYMIDAKVTGAKTISVEGTISNNTAECVLQGSNTYDGKTGYKMGNDNHHISMILGSGYTFKQGDIVRVFVTQVGDYGDKTLHLYSDQGETKIGSIDGLQLGWNEWFLPASADGISTICVYRHGAANDQAATNQNHYIYEMQVIRLEDCYDCASKEPTITIPQATGNPPQLCTNYPYTIIGSLEGALSGYWTETSDASDFGDVHQSETTITFSKAGTYTLTWTVSDEHSNHRWGCRKTTQQTVEVIDAFPVELHTSCEHRVEERPSKDNPSKVVTFSINGCSNTQGHYLPNDHLLVTAVGDNCNDFKQWSDGVTDNPRLFVVGNSDFTVTPNFEHKQFTVRVISNNGEIGDVDIVQP